MSPLLFRILSAAFPLQWGSKYSRLDKSPAPWELTLLSGLIRLAHALKKHRKGDQHQVHEGSASARRLHQRFAAFSVPPRDPEKSTGSELPAIRLLWVSHPKDFDVLPLSVLGALRHVTNRIVAIDVVSPSPQEAEKALTNQIPATTPVSYVHDSDVVSEALREELTKHLSSHGSWATQQLIKVLMALRHSPQPTLVIDSDTVLLRDKVWLDSDGRQLLYFRGYTNPRYQHYLRSWGMSDADDVRSFVTHHMLFQPEILRTAMVETFASTEAQALVEAICSSARQLGFPEFSMDYELYGHVLWSRCPQNYFLDKYSNIGLARPRDFASLEAVLAKLRQQCRYNSASFHLPNR